MTEIGADVEIILNQMNAAMPAPADFDVATFRGAVEAREAPPEAGPPLAAIENSVIPGPGGTLPMRIYRPSHDAGQPVVIYLHGGGFILTGLDNEDAYCRRLASGTGVTVCAIDHRPAPEHPFPAAVDDAVSAMTYVHDRAHELGVDRGRIAIAGMSSGATVAAGAVLRCRDGGGPPISLQVLLVPLLRHRADTPSRRAYGRGAHGVTTAYLDWASDQYALGPEADHPHCAPLRSGDLRGLPPAYICTAEFDPLRDDGVEYARRFRAAGVPVEHREGAGLFHGFHFFADVLRSARDEVSVELATLRRLLAERPAR